ncbi:MAG: carboxypeptidase-like regulatory domain-containing protein, partial [Polyangiaceae bacterium]
PSDAAHGGPPPLVLFRRSKTARPAAHVTLAGVVRDSDGHVLPGAAVWADGQRTTADRSGAYRVSLDAHGVVKVQVFRPGDFGIRVGQDVPARDGVVALDLTVPCDSTHGCPKAQ